MQDAKFKSNGDALWMAILSSWAWFVMGIAGLVVWIAGMVSASWQDGQISSLNQTWSLWLTQTWLGAVGLLLIARIIEQISQLRGPSRPPLEHSETDISLTLPVVSPHKLELTELQDILAKALYNTQRRGAHLLWWERGRIAAWGQLCSLCGWLLAVIGLLAAPQWPSLQLAIFGSICGLLLLTSGLLLQWSEEHGCIALWLKPKAVVLWAHSSNNWPQLQSDIQAISAAIAQWQGSTTSHQS
jgi:hypothetical protein